MKQETLNRCLTDVGSLLPSFSQQQAELSVLSPNLVLHHLPPRGLVLSAPPERSKPGHSGPECQGKMSTPRVLLQSDLLLAL